MGGDHAAPSGPDLTRGVALSDLPDGSMLAGPVRQQEETLIADLDLGLVASGRRLIDPVGHYNRPDIFRLHVDTTPRRAVVVESFGWTRGT